MMQETYEAEQEEFRKELVELKKEKANDKWNEIEEINALQSQVEVTFWLLLYVIYYMVDTA